MTAKCLPFVSLNGVLGDRSSQKISIFDHGLVAGHGVFETIAVYHGQPFAWVEHIERLRQGLRGVHVPLTQEQESSLKSNFFALAEKNKLKEVPFAKLRLYVTGGESNLGSNILKDSTANICMAMVSLNPPTGEATQLSLIPWTRNERGALVGLKTTSYAENVKALFLAHEEGSSESLFLNTHGFLCEGTGTNLFYFHGDRLITPPLESGCLAGITRHFVLLSAQKLGIEVQEKLQGLDALLKADSVFLTSTTRELQLVAAIVDGAKRFEKNAEATELFIKLQETFRSYLPL